MDDLFDLGPVYSATVVSDTFGKQWEREVRRARMLNRMDGQLGQKQVARALLRSFGRQWAISACYKLIGDLASIAGPLVIRNLIDFIQECGEADPPPPLSTGLGMVLLLFVLQVTSTLATHAWQFHSQMVGLKARTALSSAVYAKALRLSNAARQKWSLGKVMNLVATDLPRIDNIASNGHILWAAPVQIIVGSVFLFRFVGVAALGGLAVFTLFMPIQTAGMRVVTRKRRSGQLISDQRVKLTNELLQGIKIVKLLTWETPFFNKINTVRDKEVELSRQVASWKAVILGFAQSIPALGSSAVFLIYAALGKALDAGIVFGSLSLFNVVRAPLWQLPQTLSMAMDAKVAMERLTDLLLAEELTSLPLTLPNDTYAIQACDASFAWGGAEQTDVDEGVALLPRSIVRNVTLAIPHGQLVAVVGKIGSAKSSLLSGLIGEMKRTTGTVNVAGTLAYCPQTAWIQASVIMKAPQSFDANHANASLLSNILFGRPMDRAKYESVLRSSCLEKDLLQLPDGDLTEIGEKGINLSGGQKARVNLARALYADPDIYLLDDVLAAVDAHVGAFLFNQCIRRTLHGKTRILVTHALSYVSQCDYVIVMDEGRIDEMGTFDECMKRDGNFAEMMRSYGGNLDDRADDSASQSHAGSSTASPSKQSSSSAAPSERTEVAAEGEKKRPTALMTREERATGAVTRHVYAQYVKYCGGWTTVAFMMVLVVLGQGVRVANNLWLAWWTSDAIPGYSTGQYMLIYLLSALVQTFLLVVSGLQFAYAGTCGAQIMHDVALHRVLRAPLSFFDQTPIGRILSRFSKDCDSVTNNLPDAYRMFTRNMMVAVSSLLMMCSITPLLVLPLIVLGVLYFMVQRFYRASSRELKRLDSLSRSPVFALVGETLNGVSTIRAYREEGRFIESNHMLLDRNNRPYFCQVTALRWLGVRLETCSAALVAGAGLLGILGSGTVSPALVGVVLSSALQVTSILNTCVRQGAELENQMNGVERLDHYAHHIPAEAPFEVPDVAPPLEWPSQGRIELRHLTMSYRAQDGLPPVLKDLNVVIPGGARVGIVGRTGAGKSSIVAALLRLVEATDGRITIDGINVGILGLRDLRSRIAIIPQDPVLFSGTIRSNLDRFSQYDDAQLWDRLQRAGLYDLVSASDDKLDMAVAENGENLSLGERCCLCLARAMMGRRKILIMDEATASIDLQTEERIQESLRRDFADVTVLTIAHRLNTVIDYDYILSMDAGRIVEFGPPAVLLQRGDSLFASLVDETGQANAQMLRNMAAAAYASK
ncbi:hypothetical protein RI367_002753 [Sorochytrium milnesiophthora]